MKRSEMKKQGVYRDYNFPDADLYLWSKEVLALAQRDFVHFEEEGFDAKRMKAFENLCEIFRECPSDDELIGEQMLGTEKKNEASDALTNAIRAVMNRVAILYSNRTGRYRKFGTAKIGDMTDAQLLFCGRRVARVARAQFDFLEETGLNEGHISRVQTAAEAFERALNVQQDKLHDRDIGVETRTEVGNRLYKIFVIVCGIGKAIWTKEQWAKYENFVIYESNNEQKKRKKEKDAAEKSGEK